MTQSNVSLKNYSLFSGTDRSLIRAKGASWTWTGSKFFGVGCQSYRGHAKTVCRLQRWSASHTGWHPESVSLKPTVSSHWAGTASHTASPSTAGFSILCTQCSPLTHRNQCVCERDRGWDGVYVCPCLFLHTHSHSRHRQISVWESSLTV